MCSKSPKRKINSCTRSVSSPSHFLQPQKPILWASRSTCWTHSHVGSTSRSIMIRRPRTLRQLGRSQINRPLAATIATSATSTQWRLSYLIMGRHLFGSFRQNTNPIHKRISVLCRLHMRMARCQTL